MQVRDLMKPIRAMFTPEMTLKEAAAIICEQGIDGAVVKDDQGRLAGIITKSHLVKAIGDGGVETTRVGQAMTRKVFVLSDAMPIVSLQNRNEIYKYSLYPVVDDHGNLCGIISRTDLVKYLSDRSLFLAGELRAILNSLHSGVIAVNKDGVVVLFNHEAERLTNMSAANALGLPVEQVLPDSGLMRVLRTGVAELNQKQHIGNCQIITNRTPIKQGAATVGAVAIFQDITQLATVAAELEDVKSLKSTLESAMESIFECIVVVDKDGFITMLNRAYCEFLGVEAKDVIGKHVTEVIENTRMHIVAQTGKPEVAEIQQIRGRNTVVTRIPIVRDGETVGAVGKVMFKDIKDLKIMATKFSRLQSELEYYKEELRKIQGGHYTLDSIVGVSEKIEWLKSVALKAARGNSTVLVLGESGTGKELFAHAIHNASLRRHGPFIKVNCAAMPENLLESELFGYEEGAFTGARKGGKPGKFELANGGTIFLDEIGDMTLAMQAKLLRVLQEREIDRVGGTKSVKVDVRVIAATNRDLEAMIERGEFRQDLYYRLNVITLHIPPLRERKEDIPELGKALLAKISAQLGCQIEGIAPETMELLLTYPWPGNIREMENVLERAVNLIDDETYILPEHLPPGLRKLYKPRAEISLEAGRDLNEMMFEAEKQALLKALEAAGGNRSKAAKLLGIHRSGLYQKMQKYNIR
ncbi:MAG: sigma-54-dependent Fis family transcriptional regulator [Negativicutes bacterium]|nr:sigma-54-dependent Fis family transcriptional regulator [Negativicutes bacterium]